MALTTYSDLKTTIASYLGRSDLTTQIPDFINLAETRLSRELRTRKMLKSAFATIPAADAKISIPTDFLQMRDIYLDGSPRIAITYLSPSAFTRDARTIPGMPIFYTSLGLEFEFAPVPDKEYRVELLYYAKPPVLSDTNASNQFLAEYSDALLYASLAEAEPYLMNDSRTQVWATMYDRAIANISASDDGSEYSGVPLSMKVTSR